MDAELICVKLTFVKEDPIYICSYYRPPIGMLQSLLELHESQNKLTNNSISFPNIILAEDFNLPGVVWPKGSG